MKKRIIIPLILVILVLFLIFIYWYSYSGKMVLEGIENIKNITVTVYPCNEQKRK